MHTDVRPQTLAVLRGEHISESEAQGKGSPPGSGGGGGGNREDDQEQRFVHSFFEYL